MRIFLLTDNLIFLRRFKLNLRLKSVLLIALILMVFYSGNCLADEKKSENASNPLAAVNNTDFRGKSYDFATGIGLRFNY